MSLISNFKKELKEYCSDNGYEYQKLLSMPRCGNADALYFQHVESAMKSDYLDDSEPAEIVLELHRRSDGSVSITKGINADKYLFDEGMI